MSSGFVSGGTNDEPAERDEAWLKAQQELDARALAKKQAAQGQDDGKSLYEKLQANKAAKQEAFEEAARPKNQFRSLDEDEVSFLDEVVRSERSKEAEVRREQREQLDAFRRQQLDAEKAAKQQQEGAGNAPQHDSAGVVGSWSTGARKRRKSKELLGGVKLRRTSTDHRDGSATFSGAKGSVVENTGSAIAETKIEQAISSASSKPSTVCKEPERVRDQIHEGSNEQLSLEKSPGSQTGSMSPTSGLGLVGYSSDEDDE